jgi:4-carboxymuconolactone decarboxylase
MTSRILPAEPPYPPAIQALLERINPPGAPTVLALFRVLVKHPELADRMRTWGGFFLGAKATLALRDREVVINRVCARCGAEYEWGVHVAAFGRAAGFTKAQDAAIADLSADDSVLTPRDRLLLALVDALHDGVPVGDGLWAELTTHWDEMQLVELLMLAGWYHAISYVCTTLRLPPEPWAARYSAHS